MKRNGQVVSAKALKEGSKRVRMGHPLSFDRFTAKELAGIGTAHLARNGLYLLWGRTAGHELTAAMTAMLRLGAPDPRDNWDISEGYIYSPGWDEKYVSQFEQALAAGLRVAKGV